MPDKFIEFQTQVEAVISRATSGEITAEEQDATIRDMWLEDDEWADLWMFSPNGQWFRKANGSKHWVADYPLALVDTPLPPLSQMNLHQIAKAVNSCTLCPLSEGRKRAVPGEGSHQTDIMMIGEGPGAKEDKQGSPFVGASGKFLESLLGNIGYKRADVFIANVVKCRPPSNRDPKPEELTACTAYLDRQIELIDPKVIVTLGRFSMYRYFPGASISKIHGQPKQVDNRFVVPMFHPAAALHQPKWRPVIIEDFEKLPGFIEEAALFGQSKDKEIIDPFDVEQLSLF